MRQAAAYLSELIVCTESLLIKWGGESFPDFSNQISGPHLVGPFHTHTSARLTCPPPKHPFKSQQGRYNTISRLFLPPEGAPPPPPTTHTNYAFQYRWGNCTGRIDIQTPGLSRSLGKTWKEPVGFYMQQQPQRKAYLPLKDSLAWVFFCLFSKSNV